MNVTSKKRLQGRLYAAAVAAVLAIGLATSLPGWVGRAWAGTDGDISLNSFVSSSSCSSTNCAVSSTGFTNKGSGVGLYARADNGDGLSGFSLAGGAGVIGYSNTSSGVEGHGGNGVYGEGTENGIQAKGGTFGAFIQGTDYGTYSSGPNYGVFGTATGASGTGVWGDSDSGTGVSANSPNGTALQVTGKALFSRSGVATVTVASGKPYVQVSLGKLSSSTFVVATVQGNPAGIWVKSVAVTPASSYFRIFLNKVPTKDIRVGWFVLG